MELCCLGWDVFVCCSFCCYADYLLLVTLLNRERLSVNTLALTAIIMLVSNPNSLFDIGFQLSFISVWSILLFYPLIYELIPLQQKKSLFVIRWLWGMIAVSLAAQLGTAPLIAFYFGRVSTDLCC